MGKSKKKKFKKIKVTLKKMEAIQSNPITKNDPCACCKGCKERIFQTFKCSISDFVYWHPLVSLFFGFVVLMLILFFTLTSTYTLNATVKNVGYRGVTVVFQGMYESDNEQQLTVKVNNPSEYQVGDIVTIEIRVGKIKGNVMQGKICTPPNTMASIVTIGIIAVVVIIIAGIVAVKISEARCARKSAKETEIEGILSTPLEKFYEDEDLVNHYIDKK